MEYSVNIFWALQLFCGHNVHKIDPYSKSDLDINNNNTDMKHMIMKLFII